MVSSRLVDLPDSPEVQHAKPIPQMMFAAGEEPIGVRVLTYQSSGAIRRILNTLEAEEIDFIKGSSFGKIVEIAEKPVFSGRFARYLLSRQLKTKKKHEAWFRFTGKPVRFSLREFAIVTGLPCGKFPRRSKQKLRETIADKPYWPSLFGKSDVVTVDCVIKMLRRRTVMDREIRIKFACLAILESVLLPTSLKMKICREHAEAIKDFDDFFSYLWGRMAFDLLMTSIKERDEVALSQDNIAVKGFALALQLVLVEAVPALTEVVQESCSSSESDSEDDGLDQNNRCGKEQKLNPSHARNVDKKRDVVVRSILDDSLCHLDDSIVSYSDEEDDETVDNMVDLVNVNHSFGLSLYVGGMSKLDVDRMRQASPPATKSKGSRKHFVNPISQDQSAIVSLVIGNVKPQLDSMEKMMKQSSSSVASLEDTVINRVHLVLEDFKAACLRTVESMVAVYWKDYTQRQHGSVENVGGTENLLSALAPGKSPVDAGNDNSIENVIQNLSAYSTPPTSPRNSHAGNSTPKYRGSEKTVYETNIPDNRGVALSAQSQNHSLQNNINQTVDVANMVPLHLMEMPSFSLGLTQEGVVIQSPLPDLNVADNIVDPQSSRKSKDVANMVPLHVMEMPSFSLGLTQEGVVIQSPLPDINVAHNIVDPQSSRKSKRQKTVLSCLVEDYHCGPHILSRVWRSQKVVFVRYEKLEMERKFISLCEKLKGDVVINVAGLSVSSREMVVMAERPRVLYAKVMDIMIRLVRFVVLPEPSTEVVKRFAFLDTKFGAAIVRNYPKFWKSKQKESYIFPKRIMEYFGTQGSCSTQPIRNYFPFLIGKKHWIGICFDASGGHLYVFDCNMSLTKEATMAKFVTPLLQMLPYLATHLREDRCEDGVMPCSLERSKGVSQICNPQDSGLMAVLLMVTLAVYGMEACRNIASSSLEDEGKSAAIIAYEFKEEL